MSKWLVICICLLRTTGSLCADPVCRISLNIDQGRIILPAEIGSSGPLKLILDTGMGYDGALIYNPDARASIRLDNPKQYLVSGAGGGNPSSSLCSESMSLSIGGKSFQKQKIIVLQQDAFRGFPTDGVVGYSILGHSMVEIDYDHAEMRLHEPGSMTPDASWEKLPLVFRDNAIPWIRIEVTIGDGPPIPLECYIDSAARESVVLLTGAGQKVPVPSEATPVLLGKGLSGDIYGQSCRIARLKIGSFEFEQLTAFSAPAEMRSKQTGADGVIGAGLLCRFNLVFDYPNDCLYIKPNRQFVRSPA